MSLSLNCPSCGAQIGEASHEDNYIQKYYYKGNKGQPICKNCNAGAYENVDRNLIIVTLVIIFITFLTGILVYLFKNN